MAISRPRHVHRAMRRRAAVLTTTTLVGIVGLTLLEPHVPDSVLETNHIDVQVLGVGDDKQVVIETQYLRHETRNAKEDRAPDTVGWLAVWQGLTDKGWQVFMFDGKTSKETQLTDAIGDHVDVHTDGRYVVWQGREEGKWNVYRFDAESPEDAPMKLNAASPAMHPRVSKGVVVWQQWDGDDWDIFKQDIGETPVQLTANNLPDIKPDIFHSLVVWNVVRPGPLHRIRLRNLRNGAEEDLIDSTDGQIRPAFSSDGTLSWFDFAGNGYAKQEYNFLTDILEQTVIIAPDSLDKLPPVEVAPAVEPVQLPIEEPATEEKTPVEEAPVVELVQPPVEEPAPPVEEASSSEPVI